MAAAIAEVGIVKENGTLRNKKGSKNLMGFR